MQNFRKRLDYIPLIALIVYAIVSAVAMQRSGHVLQWQHYLGFCFLGLAVFLFIKNHHAAVLMTGFSIVAALFTLVSFSVGLVTNSFYWTPFGISIPLFWGNAAILPLLILHCLVSGRYYVGILTKKYWQVLFERLFKPGNK